MNINQNRSMNNMNFTYDEIIFMLDALNGVICTPQTFAANLWGWVEYAGEKADRISPNLLISKVQSLPPDQLQKLHSQVQQFWEAGSIPDIDTRMLEVGLQEWLS